MRSTTNHLCKVLCLGFIAIVLLSVLFFWARKTCQIITFESLLFGSNASIVIKPSGLYPDEVEGKVRSDIIPSRIQAFLKSDGSIYETLGITVDIVDFGKNGHRTGQGTSLIQSDDFIANISRKKGDEHASVIYFAKADGLFVQSRISWKEDEEKWIKTIYAYAGPDGVSQKRGKEIGRFSGEFLQESTKSTDHILVFDKGHKRFYNVDFFEGKVTKGPKLAKDADYKPIQIGRIERNPEVIDLLLVPPNKKGVRQNNLANVKVMYNHLLFFTNIILVLDESGRIDYLDRESLEFMGTAGHLPWPRSYFGKTERQDFRNLLAYSVMPIVIDNEPGGLVAACVSKDLHSVKVSVFDKKGMPKDSKDFVLQYEKKAGGPLLITLRFLLENLQPPILGVASYYTSKYFDGMAAEQALFMLSNSYAGMIGNIDVKHNWARRFFMTLFIILPSILLGVLLACRVNKDAKVVGLDKKVRRWWIAGTVAFGLSAYITYRLTRPKEVLVTCVNCGKGRRVDMELCHNCQSKWQVPELVPPSWRVLD